MNEPFKPSGPMGQQGVQQQQQQQMAQNQQGQQVQASIINPPRLKPILKAVGVAPGANALAPVAVAPPPAEVDTAAVAVVDKDEEMPIDGADIVPRWKRNKVAGGEFVAINFTENIENFVIKIFSMMTFHCANLKIRQVLRLQYYTVEALRYRFMDQCEQNN